MTQNHAHQLGIFDPCNTRPTTLIGAGSVGSYVADVLTKMGVRDITAWDEDTVASHNIVMSAYRPTDVGKLKVRALAKIVKANSGVELVAHERNYAGEKLNVLGKQVTVIACVHDMPTRNTIWKKVRYNPGIELFCDTRTAGSYVEVFTVNPNDRKDVDRYEALLFPESERVQHTCGRHGVIYGSFIAAAAVAANITTYWSTGKKRWRFQIQCDTLSTVA